MRRLHIDFERRRPNPPALGWLILFAGLISVTGTGLHAWKLREAREQAAQAMRQQNLQREALIARQRATATELASKPVYWQDKRWRRAAAEMSLPWMAGLQAIERVSKPPVYLLSLKATPGHDQLTLDAEAPSLDDILTFVTNLQRAPGVRDAQLLSHQEAKDSTGQATVRFSVQARWEQKP